MARTRRIVQGQAQLLRQRADILRHHITHFFGHVEQDARQFVEPAQVADVHGPGKLVQRHGRQVMPFVKHQQAVVQVRQRLHAQRGQHQVVVGHNHLRLRQLGAGVVVAAITKTWAMPRRAGVALGRHGRPVAWLGRLGQVVAVAVPAACPADQPTTRTRPRDALRGLANLAP